MNNKINNKRKDIKLGSLSAIIISVATIFADILVSTERISSKIIEKVYAEVRERKEREYKKLDQKGNNCDDYKDTKQNSKYDDNDSDIREKQTKKLYYTQNLNLIILE